MVMLLTNLRLELELKYDLIQMPASATVPKRAILSVVLRDSGIFIFKCTVAFHQLDYIDQGIVGPMRWLPVSPSGKFPPSNIYESAAKIRKHT